VKKCKQKVPINLICSKTAATKVLGCVCWIRN